MALVRRDEVLEKALSTDETAIPRFNIIGADGSVLYRNARFELANRVVAPGTPINKIALDEILAASGVTSGTSTAYTLAQENFALSDGEEVRFRLHAATGIGATLNVNGTGAKPLRDAMGRNLIGGIPKGMWLRALYNAVVDAYVVDGGTGAVSKAGDTMTDKLTIKKDATPAFVAQSTAQGNSQFSKNATLTSDYGTHIIDKDKDGNIADFDVRASRWNNINEAIRLTLRGASEASGRTYTILHTGNIANIGSAKILTTTRITTAAKQIDIPIPSGYTRYRLIAAGLSVDYSQDDSLDTGIFNLIAKATAQTVSSREYAWEIGGFTQVITSPDVTDYTNGTIGSVPASRSANSAYMQMEIFKSGDNWAGALNGNGSSYDGTNGTPSGFCYATFTSTEISTLSLVCSDNITAGMILLEGLA